MGGSNPPPPTGGGLTSLSGHFSKLFTDLKDGASRAPSLPPRYPLQRLHSMALDNMEIQQHFSLLRVLSALLCKSGGR
jgi:hypothetical protein